MYLQNSSLLCNFLNSILMYLLNHIYFEYRKKLDLFFLSLCKQEDGK